jgi:hypothetical protein
MTKQEIKQITDNAFAHAAYVSDWDGDMGVTGKFAYASYLGDGTWDVWLRNEADLAKGLGARKLNNIIDAISGLENALSGPLQRLDGEAVYSAMPTDTLLRSAPLLGIRRRGKPRGKSLTTTTTTTAKEGARHELRP